MLEREGNIIARHVTRFLSPERSYVTKSFDGEIKHDDDDKASLLKKSRIHTWPCFTAKV